MGDRRRAPRYLLCAPVQGRAVPIVEVLVEHAAESDLTVISPQAATPGDLLVIHSRADDGVTSVREVRVESSAPVLSGNRAQFRLHLRVSAPPERTDTPGDKSA